MAAPAFTLRVLKSPFESDFHKIERVLYCERVSKVIYFRKWTVHTRKCLSKLSKSDFRNKSFRFEMALNKSESGRVRVDHGSFSQFWSRHACDPTSIDNLQSATLTDLAVDRPALLQLFSVLQTFPSEFL